MAPRTRQRERTRERLLDAIQELIDAGSTDLGVDAIASAAGTSRATFYRYFSSPAEALWHVYTDRHLAAMDEAFRDAGDVADRVARAETAVNEYLLSDPNATRAFERAMLDRTLNGTATPLDRPARRLRYIDAALEPIADDLSDDDRFLVRHALALAMGSSVVPALIDTCALTPEEARRVTRFAAEAIVREALRRSRVDGASAG
jgi:AcrR family transcriptional regulator